MRVLRPVGRPPGQTTGMLLPTTDGRARSCFEVRRPEAPMEAEAYLGGTAGPRLDRCPRLSSAARHRHPARRQTPTRFLRRVFEDGAWADRACARPAGGGLDTSSERGPRHPAFDYGAVQRKARSGPPPRRRHTRGGAASETRRYGRRCGSGSTSSSSSTGSDHAEVKRQRFPSYRGGIDARGRPGLVNGGPARDTQRCARPRSAP